MSADPDASGIFHYISNVWAIAIAIGPILGYIPQYRDIRRTKHYRGFSSAVPFILLSANILRVLSWFVAHYEFPLLFQSVLMILMQLFMLHLLVRLRGRDVVARGYELNNTAMYTKRTWWESFWAWPRFIDYIIYLAVFTLAFSIIVLLHVFVAHVPYLATLSIYSATLIESTLCMPQFYRNWVNKTTHGLSRALVFAWISGDAFKLGYFLASDASPGYEGDGKSKLQERAPFIVCAVIQIIVDIGVIFQIWWYKGRTATTDRLDEIAKPTDTQVHLASPSAAIAYSGKLDF